MTIISRLEALLKAEKDEWKQEQLGNARLQTGKTDRGLHIAGYRFDDNIFGVLDSEGKELIYISTFESKIEKELEKICEQYD